MDCIALWERISPRGMIPVSAFLHRDHPPLGAIIEDLVYILTWLTVDRGEWS